MSCWKNPMEAAKSAVAAATTATTVMAWGESAKRKLSRPIM